jgi:hypothetical protein
MHVPASTHNGLDSEDWWVLQEHIKNNCQKSAAASPRNSPRGAAGLFAAGQ